MRFRNLQAEELEGSTDIAGLDSWLHSIGATDATVLIMAPPGTGKAAAVGKLSHRLGRNVVLCNLMEIFDTDEPHRQLESLLRICEVQKNCVIYLDKLDKALVRWEKNDDSNTLAATLQGWLKSTKARLLEDECTVVFTGREKECVPESLIGSFDKSLLA
jgi:hypothetical protein